jgi:O-antigen ligase
MTRFKEMSSQDQALVLGFSLYAVSTLISMAVMSIGAAVVFVALIYGFGGPRSFADAVASELKRPEVRQYAIVMAALLGACALSLIVAMIWPLVYGGMGPTIHFVSDIAKGWYLAWPLLLVPGLKRLGHSGRCVVLRSWLVAFGVLSAIGVAQHFTGWPRPQAIPNNPGHFHATLFLGHHLSVASVFIFPFFIALGFLRDRNFAGVLPRWALGLISVLGAITLFNTYSRTLWLALPIGLLIWLLWSLPRRLKIAAAAGFVVISAAAFNTPAIRARLDAGVGIINRKRLWAANWEFFTRRPLTGTGWHHNIEISGFYLMDLEKTNHVFSGHAHNNVLDVLGGLGLIGLITWVAWCVVTMSFVWKLSHRARAFSVASALLCAWVVFQLNGVTQVNFWEAKVLHQMMWMVAWSLAWLGLATETEFP